MTKDEARLEIMFSSQNCEEIGIGRFPLTDAQLNELEENARRLLVAIDAYRAADRDGGSR